MKPSKVPKMQMRSSASARKEKTIEWLYRLLEDKKYHLIQKMDYWSFIEKDGQYGSYVDNHFVLSSDSSLESIIFRKYHHSCDLLQKLSAFMSEELHLNRD